MPQRIKKASGRRAPNLKIESYATLIDRAFAEMVDITENGRKSRMTVFSAIYKQLLHLEIMAGDRSARKARLAYDRFAGDKEPEIAPNMFIVHEGKVYKGPRR